MTPLSTFNDELLKISAPRWKTLLRLGQLSADDVSRLTRSGVLDYSKELAGLERGNVALQKYLGAPIRTIREGLLHGAKKLIKDKNPLPLMRNTAQALSTPGLGGAATYLFPGAPPSIMKSKTFFKAPGSSEAVRKATDALVTRHELDEARAALAHLRKGRGLTPRFQTHRDPKGLADKVVAKQMELQKRQINALKNSANPRLRLAGEGMEIGAAASGVNPMRVPKGQVPAGVHQSPSVILRESQNVATLHPDVRRAMLPTRVGEEAALRTQGLRYGQAPPKRKLRQVIKALEN